MKAKRIALRNGRMRRQRRGTTAHNREFLVELVFRLLMRIGRGERLGVNAVRLRAFVDACSQRYAEHPYHNWAHAADVTHTAAWLSQRPAIRAALSDEEVFWLLVAAVVHDLKHPGHGNMWEVKHDSPVARRYAYESVLENQSIDQALELLRIPAYRFTDGMPLAARERGRELLRTLVLSTDFSHHGEYVAALSAALRRRIGEPQYPRDAFAAALLPAMLKAADIGNTTKPFPQAVFWADRAMREIWAELHGDAPRAWTPQQRQTHLCRAQIDFVERNALGLFSLLGEVDRDVQGLVRTLHDNLLKYQAAAFCRPLQDPMIGDEQRPPLVPIATPA